MMCIKIMVIYNSIMLIIIIVSIMYYIYSVDLQKPRAVRASMITTCSHPYMYIISLVSQIVISRSISENSLYLEIHVIRKRVVKHQAY